MSGYKTPTATSVPSNNIGRDHPTFKYWAVDKRHVESCLQTLAERASQEKEGA